MKFQALIFAAVAAGLMTACTHSAPSAVSASQESPLSDQARQVTDDFSVSPQISVADIEAAAARGVTLIINNRPDGEMIGQPTSAEIEAAATAAGIAYAHIPVDQRGISPDHLDAFDTARAGVDEGKTLAFCRSGTRSVIVRSYAAARAGQPVAEIIAAADAAGYDIAGHAPALEALNGGD